MKRRSSILHGVVSPDGRVRVDDAGIDSGITQLKAQGPSRTCNKSEEEEEEGSKEGGGHCNQVAA